MDWIRKHLLSTPVNTALTVLVIGLLAWLLPPAINWLFIKAVWGPQPIAACDAVRGQGACWAVVWEKFRVMMFGVYPYAEQWRPTLAMLILVAMIIISTMRRFWRPLLALIWLLAIVAVFW